jgi:hypothetical protein
VESAILLYKETVEQARIRADELLKSAHEQLPHAIETINRAQAMQNSIEVYGDKYIVPGYSIFDELAYSYSFDESGRQLKLAREKTRIMIKNRQAAECDFEKNRRDTAITFVIDAFNGKVDSLLASAKTGNASTLIQKIKDAYMLVNMLG